MKDLLILEWKKFKSNAVFRVLALIYILLAPLIILAGKDLIKDIPPPFPSSKNFYEFPTVWDYQGYVGNWLVPFCLGFLIIHMITSEVSSRTMRQNILTGMTRKSFFASKLLSLICMALIATFLYVVSTITIGMIHTEGFDLELVFDNNWAIIRFFMMCVGYMSFALLLSFVIRKGTLAILIYFFYLMILEPILMSIHVYYFQNSSRNYWPMNCIEDLMPCPLFRMPDYFVNKEWDFSLLLTYGQAMGMSTLYITLFLGLAYRSFMKNDI
ncbi:MAG: ABC transporter permease subunit [Saprospiraceae bacterium]|nr:ABC transporter permease subunit [Saprospiraceae bacterium]